jgi:hypothetical protein
MSGTTVLYGGNSEAGGRVARLDNVITRAWEFKSEYDEDGTLLGHKFKAEFESVVIQVESPSPAGLLGLSGNTRLGDAPSIYNQVKRILSTPRQRLQVLLEGDTMIDIRSFAENKPGVPSAAMSGDDGMEFDVENGPKPVRVDITHITGNSVLRVVFAIEAFLSPCTNKVPPILASRWTMTETMDEDFFITRKFTGFLRKSNWSVSSAAMRQWMFPGLEDGFRRVSVEYDEHADHLGIDWRVMDRQVHVAAPWPITRLEGTQTETTGNGIQWYTEVRLRANGSPEATKRDMMQQLSRIMSMRILYNPDQINEHFKLEGVTIVDHFGEKNQIEFVTRVQHLYGATNDAPTQTFYSNMRTQLFNPEVLLIDDFPGYFGASPSGATESYKPNRNRIPNPWGYHVRGGPRSPVHSGKWEHLLRDICMNRHDSPLYVESPYPGSPHKGKREKTPPPISYTPSLTEDDTSNYGEEAVIAHYTIMRAMDEYCYQNRRIAVPVMYSTDDQAPVSSAVVDFGAPMITRYVTMEFERVGKWPAIPEPVDWYTDPNNGNIFRLLTHRVQSRAPTPGADGKQLIYHIWAQYVYVIQGNKSTGIAERRGNVGTLYEAGGGKGWALAGLPGMTYRKHLNVKKIYRNVKGHSINPKPKRGNRDPEED